MSSPISRLVQRLRGRLAEPVATSKRSERRALRAERRSRHSIDDAARQAESSTQNSGFFSR